MYKHKQPTFYSNMKSPFKSIGGTSPTKQLSSGIGQLIAAPGAQRIAKKELGRAKEEYRGAKADYMAMDFSNPYADMENYM